MPRKGENIYKRSDGRWEGRYIKSRSPAGKAKYGYVYSKSYRETKAKLLQAISNRTQQCVVPVLPDPTPMCFQSLVEAWTVIKFPRTKESTNAKYRNMLNSYILPALGSTPLEQITNSLIESFCCNLLQYGGKKVEVYRPKLFRMYCR